MSGQRARETKQTKDKASRYRSQTTATEQTERPLNA